MKKAQNQVWEKKVVAASKNKKHQNLAPKRLRKGLQKKEAIKKVPNLHKKNE